MPDLYYSADETRKSRGYPPGERPLSVFARALVDSNNNPVQFGDNLPSSIAAATTLTTAANNNGVYYLNLAGGFTVTLPALGLWHLTFIVKTAPTTAYILLSPTTDVIVGYPVASDGSDQTANGNAAGDQVNFVANVALPGDTVELRCDGAVIYARVNVKATGAVTISG